MTVADRAVRDPDPEPAATRRVLPRPTLRLRLTLFNGALLVGAGLLVLVLGWLVVRHALHTRDRLLPGSTVVRADGRVLDAAEYTEQVSAGTQRDVLRDGLPALAVIGLVGGAAGYLVAGRTLRPLRQVTATAQRLSGENLQQRIRLAGPRDEVAELADTFNAMLDRIGAAFDSQRRFVANASHELRTPLAVMRTEVEVTLADPAADIAEYRRMAGVVREASTRANGLVDALLVLARSDAGVTRLVRGQPADLAAACAVALASVGRDAVRSGLVAAADLRPAPVVGDPSLLDRLVGNLVENAVRYNHPGGRLWVRTGVADGHATLLVANTGPVVPPAEVAGLFEPFRRAGPERTGSAGAGLGLSIVRAVCAAHGGSVDARARPGGGLEVTARLPAAGQGRDGSTAVGSPS